MDDNERLDQLLADLSTTRQKMAACKREEKGLKAKIEPLVAPLEKAKYKSDAGSAAVRSVGATHSYPKVAIDALIAEWSRSPDSTLRGVAAVLVRERKLKGEYTYLEVKTP